MDAASAPDPNLSHAAALAFEERASALEADARRAAIRFAAVTCSCVPRFSWDDRTPPQAGCSVHGNLMITPGGEILLGEVGVRELAPDSQSRSIVRARRILSGGVVS